MRSSRACRYVLKPPPCTHTSPPVAVCSTVATAVAVCASSSRSCDTKKIVLGVSRIRSSSHRLVGTSRKLSGSSSSSTSCGPRRSAVRTSRFCSPPDRVRSSRCCAFSYGIDKTSVVTSSQAASASYPPTSAQSASACAYRICDGVSSTVMIASSAASSSRAAARIDASARSARTARTVRSSSTRPIIWSITPSPPDRDTVPSCGARSPATIRRSVVLPAPFGPTSATFAPSPTRRSTDVRSALPSGRKYERPETST